MAHQLLCPWDSPDKNTGVDGHVLLQGIFLTHGSNPSPQSAALVGGFFTARASWEDCIYHSIIKNEI